MPVFGRIGVRVSVNKVAGLVIVIMAAVAVVALVVFESVALDHGQDP